MDKADIDGPCDAGDGCRHATLHLMRVFVFTAIGFEKNYLLLGSQATLLLRVWAYIVSHISVYSLHCILLFVCLFTIVLCYLVLWPQDWINTTTTIYALRRALVLIQGPHVVLLTLMLVQECFKDLHVGHWSVQVVVNSVWTCRASCSLVVLMRVLHSVHGHLSGGSLVRRFTCPGLHNRNSTFIRPKPYSPYQPYWP